MSAMTINYIWNLETPRTMNDFAFKYAAKNFTILINSIEPAFTSRRQY